MPCGAVTATAKSGLPMTSPSDRVRTWEIGGCVFPAHQLHLYQAQVELALLSLRMAIGHMVPVLSGIQSAVTVTRSKSLKANQGVCHG